MGQVINDASGCKFYYYDYNYFLFIYYFTTVHAYERVGD